MNKLVWGVVSVVSCIFISEGYCDDAAGVIIIPSLGYEHKQLNFDQSYTDSLSKPINEDGRKSRFGVYLPTINFSLTAAYKRFYVAVKLERSLAENSVDVDEIRPASRSAVSDPYYLNVPNHQTDVKRSDRSITAGANVWRGLNLFAGLMQGETMLIPKATCYTDPVPCTGRNLASDMEEYGAGEYHQKYTEKGPYLGGSYGWQIADEGTISASFAYARMNGAFMDNYITYKYGDQHFDFTGKSIGSSIGLTWTAPLGESSAYYIDLRQQRYSMHGDDSNTPSTYFDTVQVKTVETMRSLTMGLQFDF